MTTTESKYDIWFPDNTVVMANRGADEQLKIAILGPQKGGKSRLAATAPKQPVYIWDFDGRLASLSGIEGVVGYTYSDTTNIKNSTAWSKIEQDMNMFEYQKSSGKGLPGTMVFDSMTYFLERAMRYVLVNNSSMRRVVKITSSEELYIPKDWDAYKAEMGLVSNMLARAVELGCDVIAVFHERAEEAPDSTKENPKYTGKFSTHPPRAAEILPLFDELWRIKPNDSGTYTVYTSPTYEFTGASCLEIDAEETPDITAMIQKHKERKGNGKT
jgi:hypothetical protein